MNTAPDTPQPKGSQSNRKPEPKTRLKRMEETGDSPVVPPNPAPYLSDWLFEIGPTETSGMGEGRLSWREIEAWEGRMGIELMPWEARLLRRLSGEYADERYEARKPDRVAPYTGTQDDVADRRAAVDRKIQAVFAGLKKAG